MKRRNILKGIVFFSLGGTTIFSCKDKYEAIETLDLKFLNLTRDQIQTIDVLSQKIVPLQSIPALNNHTALPCILNKIDKCYNKETIKDFMQGYEGFNKFVQTHAKKSFTKCTDEVQAKVVEAFHLLLTTTQSPENKSTPIDTFFDTIKSESLNYLSKTEFVQRQVRYYEMGPARFDGCVPINELKNRNKTQNG